MNSQNPKLAQLQNEWKEMFQKTLPAAATSKSGAQSKWPVHVDHCFARIILDSTVGIDAPWVDKIKNPAYRNMSEEQLKDSIDLGKKILNGEADLVELDNTSLRLRGKGGKASGKASGKIDGSSSGKRKRNMEDEGDEKESKKRKSPSRDAEPSNESKPINSPQNPAQKKDDEDYTPWLKKIALSEKSSFQKKVLTLLCQVPRGRYTTYAAISKHLSSSPRAVGNALRNNPFAPHVPCHRVLASGGGLGGFHGSWGRNGKEGLHDDKKRKLLRKEGVRFDGKGKVVGSPWEGFT